jgi:hypothetical protein
VGAIVGVVVVGSVVVGTAVVGAIEVIGTALTLTTDNAGLKMMVIVAAAFLNTGRGTIMGGAGFAAGEGRRSGIGSGKGRRGIAG